MTQKPPQLTLEECRRREWELRRLARGMLNPSHRAMLLLMAETWDRIAHSIAE
jgi:hypothetical protein